MGQAVNSGRSRSKVAAIALARMISAKFTLPSAPVEDIEQHYRNFAYMQASKDVSTINEIIPVDIDYVLELCRSFYKYRYLNAHPTTTVFSFGENSIVEFFDISRAFNKETLDLIAKEGKELGFLANGFRRIIIELNISPEAPETI